MRQGVSRCRWLRRIAASLAATLGGIGCASAHPVDPGQAIALGEDRGILVVHYTSNVRIERLDFGPDVEGLPPGHHTLLFVTRPGRYRWSLVETSGRTRFFLRHRDEFRFRVEAGRINYAGMLELHRGFWSLAVRRIDRSAMAMESIRRDYPGLLERYPMAYTGPGRNVFFEQHRDASMREGTGEASQELSADPRESPP